MFFCMMMRFFEAHDKQLYSSILKLVGHEFGNESCFIFQRLHEPKNYEFEKLKIEIEK